MDDYKVLFIPKNEVENVWMYVKGFIEKALLESQGEVSLEDIHNDCVFGNRHLWIVINSKYSVVGSLITRFCNYSLKRVLQLNYLSGFEFEKYELIMMNTVDTWAKKRGASVIELVGRKGWERRFKKHGFLHAYSVLTKSI